MVASTGLWWLDARKPPLEVVAAHLVNLAWNGLAALDPAPSLLQSWDAGAALRSTQGFSKTATWLVLSEVKGRRSHPAQRSRRRMPASLAIKSSSEGQT